MFVCLFVCLFVCGLDVGTVTSLADHTKIYFPISDIFQDVFWSKLANSIFNLVSSIAKYIDTPPRDHRKKYLGNAHVINMLSYVTQAFKVSVIVSFLSSNKQTTFGGIQTSLFLLFLATFQRWFPGYPPAGLDGWKPTF